MHVTHLSYILGLSPHVSDEKTQLKSNLFNGCAASRSKIQLGLEARSLDPRTNCGGLCKERTGDTMAFMPNIQCRWVSKLLIGLEHWRILHLSGIMPWVRLMTFSFAIISNFVCSQFVLCKRLYAQHRFMTCGSYAWGGYYSCNVKISVAKSGFRPRFDHSSMLFIPLTTHSFSASHWVWICQI